MEFRRKTPQQLQALDTFYSEDKYPTQSALATYAATLGLTYRQVQGWFAQKRRRDKREDETMVSSNGNEHTLNQRKGSDLALAGRTLNSKNKFKIMVEGNIVNRRKRQDSIQSLLSSDYILMKVFCKDGPPLGADFDCLPSGAFFHCKGTDPRNSCFTCQENQRETKVRKVSKQASSVPADCCGKMAAPIKTHGIGKGLMTVWQATNPDAGDLPTGINFGGREFMDASPVSTSSSEESLRQRKRPLQHAKTKGRLGYKVQGKRKPVIKNRREERDGEKNKKQLCYDKCELSWEGMKFQGCIDQFALLGDDEELELRELQSGKHIMASCDHFMTKGVNSCSLCKDMLAKFPPNSVKMKQPFGMQPWDSSLDIGKKLFKVLHFLYTYTIALDICPFTLDEFTQAFHDKDSFLLGKIHVALLKLLFCDIEAELSNAYLTHLSKSCKFLALVHSLESQDFALEVWKKSLNPLTWKEILRQVLVAAGFCSKQGALQKETRSKEMNLMAIYGLHRQTLKGELFIILSEQGNNGIKVSDLARESKIVELNVASTTEELELVICSTLSSDISLFERISSSAYRLRPSPATMDVDEFHSDTDFGSVDDIAANASICSSSYDSECDSENFRSQRIKIQKSKNENLTVFTEIDVSHPGEAWLLGLMEDEYSGLSIEEKLNALVALIDLLSDGSSIRPKSTSTTCAIVDCAPDIQHHGSGAKIKKSSARGHNLSTPFLPSSGQLHGARVRYASLEHHPIDSASAISKFHENSVSQGKGANKMKDAIYLHPMQSIFLGSDRRYNRYWLFLGPCNASDPGHRRVYFESSEDGHWEVIDTEEALCALLSVLDDRGKREAFLIESLEKRLPFLCEAMSNNSTRNLVSRSFTQSDQSDMDRIRESSYSPMSDVDNSLNQTVTTGNTLPSCSAIVLEVKRKGDEERHSWNRLRAFDSWVWNFFYHALFAVRHGRRSYLDSLTRCERCHDLYWRDEKHCKVCHTTFELDFNLEERYTIHRASCREEDDDVCPKHKVLSSQFQSLKAAVHAIESIMPEGAMVGAWTKSAHRLWIKRLRRTSSLAELLQVVSDFVGAINEDWFCKFADGSSVGIQATLASFVSLPQTTSALAFWLVKLDALIALCVEGSEKQIEATCRGKKVPHRDG